MQELSILLFALAEYLLGHKPVSLTHLLFSSNPPIHLRLFLFHFLELGFDVLIFALRSKFFLLHLELVLKHLVLASGLGPLFLPSLHAFTLAMEHFLV